jgi:uncharacterized protein (DUF2147 family)
VDAGTAEAENWNPEALEGQQMEALEGQQMMETIQCGARAAALGALFALSTGTPALANEPTIAGVWRQIDPSTGIVGGLISFRENNGMWEGYIVKMYPQPGDPTDPVCSACKDDRKDQPMLGLRLVQNVKRDGFSYDGGTILDPRDGSEYHVQLTLAPDNQTLIVRGYLGIPLLGQSQEWKRLSDDDRRKLEPELQRVRLGLPPSLDHSKPAKKKPADSKNAKPKLEGS